MLAISCSLYSRIYQPDVLGRESQGIFQLGKFWGTVADVLGLCFFLPRLGVGMVRLMLVTAFFGYDA